MLLGKSFLFIFWFTWDPKSLANFNLVMSLINIRSPAYTPHLITSDLRHKVNNIKYLQMVQ